MPKPIINYSFANMKESATLQINQVAKDMRAEGKRIFHFGFGQSPFPVPPKIQETLRDNAHQKDYLPTLGLPALRTAFCEHARQFLKQDLDPDCVIIGPGSKELIFQALFVLEGPLIIPAPSWVSYGPQAHLRGKQVYTVTTKRENDYKLQAEELELAARNLIVNRQKILILNHPSNPTGAVYQKEEIEALCEVCRQNDIIVIADEIYSLIHFEKTPFTSFSHIYPEGTIITSGLSKSFSAGGYRLGVLAAPPNLKEVVNALRLIISETFSAVSSPVQYAAISAFSNDAEIMRYVERCTDVHRAASDYTWRRLTEMGMTCPRPQGAFYLFPDINDHHEVLKKHGITASMGLCQHLARKYQVMLLPGSDFYLPPDHLSFRLTTVDYDGAAVIDAAFKSEQIDDAFLEKHCPRLKGGLDQLNKFMERLKSAK